ncbi:hypothetical protein SprV_0702402900 [Sparganum proliferum]
MDATFDPPGPQRSPRSCTSVIFTRKSGKNVGKLKKISQEPPIQVNNQVPDNAQPFVPTKTLEQREADYAAARRRIMGSESEDQPTAPEGAVQMPTKALCQTGVTQLSACGPVSSPKQQLPSFGSNLPHQSSTGLPSESLLSGLQTTNLGYQAAPHLFNNFSSNFLPSRNVANGAVLDDRSKTAATLNMSAMLHQLNLLRQYQQNIAACQLMQPMPSNSQVPLSSTYPAAYQRTTCNQVQNLMPSLHFQASPSRFTYSSGYN